MPEEADPGATSQWVQGNQNTQLNNIGAGSTITVTINERSWHVALEPATAPVGANVSSPARLVRARSGVLPFVDRAGLLGGLSNWIGTPEPFAVCVAGGRGGMGKTRLAVELCEQTTTKARWLSGMLPRIPDPRGWHDLTDAPCPRLVVVDYAESRIEQLDTILPALQRAATSEWPVRVLLLIRKAPQRSTDWTEALRVSSSDWLDSVLDNATIRILDEAPPDRGERTDLFASAVGAFLPPESVLHWTPPHSPAPT